MRRWARLLAAVLVAAGPVTALTAHADTPATASVSVEITSVQLPQLTPDATLTVTGTITNTTSAPLSALGVTLASNSALQSRAGLQQFTAAPAARTGIALGDPQPQSGHPGPGASVSFTVQVPDFGTALGNTTDDKVYGIGVLVYGSTATTTSATTGTVGPTFLGGANLAVPYYPAPLSAPLRTGLVIPITETPDGGPYDKTPTAELLADLGPTGRLTTVVNAVLQKNDNTSVDLLVDQALLVRVCALASKCRELAPVGTPQVAVQEAQQWLSALFSAVQLKNVTVSGLPYADADLAALVAAGDAKQAQQLLADADTTVQTTLAGAATSSLHPLVPADGFVSTALASAAAAAGSEVAIVSDSQAPAPADPYLDTVTASTELRTDSGRLAALVTDNGLEQQLKDADDPNPPMTEQRLLAELALITSERPNADQRTAVLMAPREWNPQPGFADALLRDLGTVPWVASEGLDTLEGATPLARVVGTREPAGQAGPLPQSTISDVGQLSGRADTLHALAVDPAETLTPSITEQLRRALSADWRGAGAATGQKLMSAADQTLDGYTSKVVLAGNTKGGVLLTGASGTLPLQAINGLPEAIDVIVHIAAEPAGQVTGRDQRIELPATANGATPTSRQLNVQITARSTRSTTVEISLLTAAAPNAQIGPAIEIPVRSTAVGAVAVGITAGALTVLVLALAIRGVRRVLARRRGDPPAGADPDEVPEPAGL